MSNSSSISNLNDNDFKLWVGLVNALLLRGTTTKRGDAGLVELSFPQVTTMTHALMWCIFKVHYQDQRGRLPYGGLTKWLETWHPNGRKDHVILQVMKVLTSRIHAMNWVSKWRSPQKARFFALLRVNLVFGGVILPNSRMIKEHWRYTPQ